MEKSTMFFATNQIYDAIIKCGGVWNGTKERPIVCLLQSVEHPELYWAVPVGMYHHRDEEAKRRIDKYLEKDSSNIESCYYHIGRTTTKSIFFISDVIPITDKYINYPYLGYDSKPYVIKNKKLLEEVNVKLGRVLAYESRNPDHFRQHITSIKEYLLSELSEIGSDNEI